MATLLRLSDVRHRRSELAASPLEVATVRHPDTPLIFKMRLRGPDHSFIVDASPEDLRRILNHAATSTLTPSLGKPGLRQWFTLVNQLLGA